MVKLEKNRWEILKIISNSNATPTEISKKLKISLPAVSSHINSLETQGFIEKTGEKKGKTRSYNIYSLKKDLFHFIKITPGEVSKGTLEIDNDFNAILEIYRLPQKEFRKSILDFWYDIQKHLENIKAIAIYGSVAKGNAKEDSDIDILIISDKDKIDEEYSAKMFKNKMVMGKTFSEKDFLNSKNKGSLFIKEIQKTMHVIYDPKNILKNENK